MAERAVHRTTDGAMHESGQPAMVASIEDIASEVEQGPPFNWDELDELRCASRRLRRAIEVLTISRAMMCLGCEDMFVPSAPADRYCSEGCRESSAT